MLPRLARVLKSFVGAAGVATSPVNWDCSKHRRSLSVMVFFRRIWDCPYPYRNWMAYLVDGKKEIIQKGFYF